jgi:hypothetical protein
VTALMGSRGTSQTGPPTWWASLVVRTAALPLPSEHRWQRLRNPEGGWYRECRGCGKQRHGIGGPTSSGGTTLPMGPA